MIHVPIDNAGSSERLHGSVKGNLYQILFIVTVDMVQIETILRGVWTTI